MRFMRREQERQLALTVHLDEEVVRGRLTCEDGSRRGSRWTGLLSALDRELSEGEEAPGVP